MKITKDLLKIIQPARYPVLYTGPRMSNVKGINDNNTFFLGERLIDILTVDNLKKHNPKIPQVCSELVKKAQMLSPTKQHFILKQLGITIITENIDGLHKKAGSYPVIELHGSLRQLICTTCNFKIDIDIIDKDQEDITTNCPFCHIGSIRPDIVFIGEPLRDFHKALEEICKADLLIVLGHDPDNWPACRLIAQAIKNRSCRTIIL